MDSSFRSWARRSFIIFAILLGWAKAESLLTFDQIGCRQPWASMRVQGTDDRVEGAEANEEPLVTLDLMPPAMVADEGPGSHH